MAQQVKKKKKSTCNAGYTGVLGSIPGSGRSSGEGNGNPFPYGNEKSLPEKSHGQRSLMGYSPWSHKESNMTEQLSTMGK